MDKQASQIIPEVGMGVTYLCGSDRYPFTIVKVNTPRKLTIQADEEANYLRPHFREIRKHKDGSWRDTNGMRYRVGDRESYIDPSF